MTTFLLAAVLAAALSAPPPAAAAVPGVAVQPSASHVITVSEARMVDGALQVSGEIARRRMAMRSRPFARIALEVVSAEGAVLARSTARPAGGLLPRRSAVPFSLTLEAPVPAGARLRLASVR